MNQTFDFPFETEKTYKPRRWNGFISDIKEESSAFKQVLKDAKTSRDKSNEDYEKFAIRSYKVIHRPPKGENKYNNSVPRLSAQSQRPSRNKNRSINLRGKASNSSDLPFEYDVRITNHDKWPNRPSSAYRIFKSVRLNDYPDVQRKKDMVCVMGSPIRSSRPKK